MIELLTSMAIITLITGIFLANYRDAEKRNDLTLSAQNLVSDIHIAQSNSLGLAEYIDAGVPTVPPGGWGVHFSSADPGNDGYVIFADLNSDGRYNDGEGMASSGARVITFSRNIRIKEFNHLSGPTLDLTFLPPDPITNISDEVSTTTEADIVLTELGKNNTKAISINFLGLAEVVD